MFDTLFRLADHDLDARLASLFERDRALTTELLAHIAESDARRRYGGRFKRCVNDFRRRTSGSIC